MLPSLAADSSTIAVRDTAAARARILAPGYYETCLPKVRNGRLETGITCAS